MIKIIILIVLYINTYANQYNIKALQEEFYTNVIEINVFRKRFENYLNKNCEDNLSCIKEHISILKSWENVKNDDKLKYLLDKHTQEVKFDQNYWDRTLEKLQNKKIDYNATQFVSVIDLSRQIFTITLWDNENKTYNFIGQDQISSGNINREIEVKYGEDHYLKTPKGIFKSKGGWRSDGQYKKDKVTLGYGYKDRYIFYFGKHKTIRYNSFDKQRNKILDKTKWPKITDFLNLAVHSHKSSKKLGSPHSHGCVRMTDEMNRFLDNNLVLHKSSIKNNTWSNIYSEPPKNPNYYNIAGEYLIIFDNI